MTKVENRIGGVSLGVENQADYLAMLWTALRQFGAEFASLKSGPFQDDFAAFEAQLTPVLAEIEATLETEPVQLEGMNIKPDLAMIGYHTLSLLVPMLDRDWFAYEDVNEFAEMIAYLDRERVFETAESVQICGAGVCGLGDYVASLSHVRAVTCSDLSWLSLYLGRLLQTENEGMLPSVWRLERLFYKVDRSANTLQSWTQPFKRRLPRCGTPDKLRYEVRNAFAFIDPIQEQMLCAAYLLDMFGGRQMGSLVIRLCQQLAVDQQLTLLVTLRFHPELGRDPQAIARCVTACGLEIEFLDITRLPYTFAYHNFGSYRMEYNTLVLRATKRRPTDPKMVGIIVEPSFLNIVKDEMSMESGRSINSSGKMIVLTNRERQLVRQADGGATYHDLLINSGADFPAAAFDSTIGQLAAKEVIHLEIAST
jgi:hypothetical protein